MEHLPYNGQSPQDRAAFAQYLNDLKRGKSLTQLQTIASSITPQIHSSWSPRSFTPVTTADGKVYDAVVCNISYPYNKHGYKSGSLSRWTLAAKNYFALNQHLGKLTTDGLLKMPNDTLFEKDGKIVTFLNKVIGCIEAN